MTKARDIASAAPAPSTVSATELGYLDGVSSAIQTQIDGKVASSLVDAKGDLLVGSADNTLSRLAVSDNGSTLVADSSASVGLRYQSNFAAGKNKIINGDFNIWQRGTTFTVSASNQFTADRFSGLRDGNGTLTVTRQSFTAGTAPVAGYENQYFAQYALTSAGTTTYYTIWQPVEDVRTFAGQTITVSFWARLSTGSTGNGYIRAEQNFGSGGSGSVNTDGGSFTFTSTWTRYSATLSIPSISGKTVGSSSYLGVNVIIPTGGNTGTLQVWGIQAEAGNVATAFQTATGTLAGELQAAQRYYWRSTGSASSVYPLFIPAGYFSSTTVFNANVLFPVTMRTTPTSVDFGNLTIQDNTAALLPITAITVDGNTDTPYGAALVCTVTGATSQRTGRVLGDNSATAHLGFSAEL